MKRILIIAIVCVISSGCSVLLRERESTALFLDFRPYAESGFFLSPNDYAGDFTSVGMLDLVVDPAVVKAGHNHQSNKFEDGVYLSPTAAAPVLQEQITAEELVDMAVAEALKMGANGISNLKITVEKDMHVYKHGLFSSPAIEVDRYVISGFCIKIK